MPNQDPEYLIARASLMASNCKELIYAMDYKDLMDQAADNIIALMEIIIEDLHQAGMLLPLCK